MRFDREKMVVVFFEQTCPLDDDYNKSLNPKLFRDKVEAHNTLLHWGYEVIVDKRNRLDSYRCSTHHSEYTAVVYPKVLVQGLDFDWDPKSEPAP